MYSPRWAKVNEDEDRVDCVRCGRGVDSYCFENIEHSDNCTRLDSDEPRWAELIDADDSSLVKGVRCSRCASETQFQATEPQRLDDEFLSVEHEVNCTRNECESMYVGSITQPEFCPRCGEIDAELDSLDRDSRENGDLEFTWRCPECTLKFATISELPDSTEDEHVLQWAYHEDELQSVLHLHAEEDSAAAKWKRAEKNMKFGNCYEVSGAEWIITDLFELITESREFELVENGTVDVVEEVPGLGDEDTVDENSSVE